MKILAKIFSIFVIIPLVLTTPLVEVAKSDKDTVVYLHVLFRHGNRTPDKSSSYPTDPHRNQTFEPYGLGQLTTKGKKTEFDIGRYLRGTYGNLIPKQYTPNVAYAISTNTKRTKMSLELVLAGLFPPVESDIFYKGLEWQPISFIVEQDEQLMSLPTINCANFILRYYKFMLSKEGQEIITSYQDIYQKLSNLTGLEIRTPEDVIGVFSTLTSQEDLGLELPRWTKDYFPKILEDISSWYFEFAAITPGLRRLMNGRLIKKIIDDSKAVRAGTASPEKKISLYSAHDMHVSTLLRSLNAFERHMPPYGATIIFELHNIKGSYFIKLYYQDYTQSTPKLLVIPGCGRFCELDKLTELMSDNFPGPGDICTYPGELM